MSAQPFETRLFWGRKSAQPLLVGELRSTGAVAFDFVAGHFRGSFAGPEMAAFMEGAEMKRLRRVTLARSDRRPVILRYSDATGTLIADVQRNT